MDFLSGFEGWDYIRGRARYPSRIAILDMCEHHPPQTERGTGATGGGYLAGSTHTDTRRRAC